jgi:hypothetical protein
MTMDNGQKTMGKGRKTMDDGRKTTSKGRKTMDDGRKTTKNKARSTKNVIAFHRGGHLDDAKFYACMAVDENMPFYLGVLELLDRAEDEIWDRNRDAELSREARADLGLQAGVVREIRAQLVAAREYGVKKEI